MRRAFLFRAALLAGLVPAALHGEVIFSEIHYHPPDAELEFLELLNTGATPVSLGGATFEGILYTFGATTLPPGGRTVVARNRTRLEAVHGPVPGLAAGNFDGRLADEGETLRLLSASGAVLAEVTYRPDGGWPDRPDGFGSSLERSVTSGDPDDPAHWRASSEFGGTPGREGAGPLSSVVINEVLTHTDPPLEDAVELFNPTAAPVDIGGWWLSDNRANPTKYRIPAGTTVPAEAFLVIYEQQFNSLSPAPGDTPFTFNAARGDDVVLVAPGTDGTPGWWIQDLHVDAAENGVSFGRVPDGTGPLVTLAGLTFGTGVTAAHPPELLPFFRTGAGASNSLPRVGPLALRRIQYHPAGEGDEYLELENTSTRFLPLFDPVSSTNHWILDDAVRFTFPDDIVLAPAERVLVVGVDPAAFRSRNPVPATQRVFGPWTGALDNAGERIRLLKPDPVQMPPHPDAGYVPYILVEEVAYHPDPPWPPEADGGGPALRRRDIGAYADDPGNWEADLPALLELRFERLPSGLDLLWTQPADIAVILETLDTLDSGAEWTELVRDDAPGIATPRSRRVTPDRAAAWFRLRAE